MTEILSFTQELALRSKYKKLLYKSQDAEAAQSLDTQLTHAFRIFEEGYTVLTSLYRVLMTLLRSQIQSSVSLRISQQQVVQQLSSISLTVRTTIDGVRKVKPDPKYSLLPLLTSFFTCQKGST